MNDPPFKRDEFLDKPGIVGARWWHEGLHHADPVGRRTALKALLVGGGLLTVGVLVAKASGCSSSDYSTVPKSSLEMQQQFGWNFGAATETVTFDGTTVQPFQPELVARLATDLAPVRVDLHPYFVPTLLQSLVSTPAAMLPEDPNPFLPLRDTVRPIRTPAMDLAYLRGGSLASLFARGVPGVAVVVDLPGPESIAFAAGAAGLFDPVFAIDNWPHPHGIVAAHLALAAALFYQPLFAKAAAERASAPGSAPPMFILDRDRLTTYTDDGSHFDNRHLARLPSAGNLRQLGIQRVLYVAPLDTSVPELDDLNDVFHAASVNGLTVKMVGASAFGPDTTAPTSSAYYYGHSAATHEAFWVDYPWISPIPALFHPPDVSMLGRDYVPVARATAFSGGVGTAKTRPPSFGMVPVIVAAGTGAILGAVMNRSGSWNRSSGGWGG